MARTFTGLKLEGSLGRFGKKEISDIEGYVELPDGKVLSGSEWGNMLLWDGGLIKVEICRKNKKPWHQGSIQQIIMDEGELMTIGNDGYIRVSQYFSSYYLAVILVHSFIHSGYFYSASSSPTAQRCSRHSTDSRYCVGVPMWRLEQDSNPRPL